MRITVVEDYEDLSDEASEILLKEIEANPNTHCCLATGSSPTGMYEHFCGKVIENKLDLSHVRWTKLDEWLGISLDNPSSCEYYIRKHVLTPLNISDDNYLSLNSEAKNLDRECERVTEAIKARPLDVCILGLGVNGHLGLNEPGDELLAMTHVVLLDPLSKQHPMLSSQEVTGGISLGMSEILHAKKIIFLVSGKSKVNALKELMTQRVSTNNPASFLWLHPNVDLIVEQEIFDSI